MALPNKIQVNAITGASQPSLIDNDINNFKTAVQDLFGIPDNTNISQALMTVNASGLDNVIFRDTVADPDTAGELQRHGTAMKYHNGSVVATLLAVASNTVNIVSTATVALGTNANDGLALKTNNTNRITISNGGITTIGHTTTTGAAAGDVVMGNLNRLAWRNGAGTTSDLYAIQGNSSNDLLYNVPASTNEHAFGWAGNSNLRLVQANSGAGILFIGESSADHPAPTSDSVTLYIKDNGAGKTQLCARFTTGAVQVIATQP